MKIALIYPNQLYASHPALKGADQCFLIEEPLLFGTDREWSFRFHIQKLILHRASLLAYNDYLLSLEIDVHLLQLEGARHTDDMLDRLPRNIDEIQVVDLVDNVLSKRLRTYCERKDIELTFLDNPNFVTPTRWADSFFTEGKKPFMASFYEAQRKRMDILVDADGRPVGDKWSFDEDNRKKLPRKIDLPEKLTRNKHIYVAQAAASLKKEGLNTWGDESHFIYPITHQAAVEWLEKFLEDRFSNFGTYEDALSTRDPFLFHSVLTPILNIGLLNPQEVITKALDFGKNNDVAINNIEGFVRQIIGWREFMKIMYEKHGTYLRTKNFFKFESEIPASIYNGRTGILPVDVTLDRLNKYAYSHHIERLMVMGNLFVLLRVKPDAVYRWFMEMYIDAYDWVMVPNVYGMSQFSDGGLLVTKPYVSGSNYIRKMSDYKPGPWCDAWDSLFWTFVNDEREFFSSQYRMKMMLSHLNKMSADKLEKHYNRATDVRETLAAGKVWGENGLL